MIGIINAMKMQNAGQARGLTVGPGTTLTNSTLTTHPVASYFSAADVVK
jgi:hypothetical protein